MKWPGRRLSAGGPFVPGRNRRAGAAGSRLATTRGPAITRPPGVPRATAAHGRAKGSGMRNTARWVWGAAGAVGLIGCTGLGGEPVVRDAARPHANAILADAPALLPQVPVTSTSATRGQNGG